MTEFLVRVVEPDGTVHYDSFETGLAAKAEVFMVATEFPACVVTLFEAVK